MIFDMVIMAVGVAVVALRVGGGEAVISAVFMLVGYLVRATRDWPRRG